MSLISSELKKISSLTIQKCFSKCGFKFTQSDLIEENPDEDDEKFWNNLKLLVKIEFETFDSYFICHDNLSEEEIIKEVTQQDQSDSDTEIEMEIEVPSEVELKVTSSEAFKRVNKLKKYFLNTNNSKAFETLLNLEIELIDVQFKNVKQTKITDFFLLMISI